MTTTTSQFDEFDRRMRRINRRHSRLSRGYVTSVNADGLLVATPIRRRTSVPLRGVVVIIAALMLFKGIVLAQLGPAAYEERLEGLAGGNQVEQVGAWIMKADPTTTWIASHLGPLLR